MKKRLRKKREKKNKGIWKDKTSFNNKVEYVFLSSEGTIWQGINGRMVEITKKI